MHALIWWAYPWHFQRAITPFALNFLKPFNTPWISGKKTLPQGQILQLYYF